MRYLFLFLAVALVASSSFGQVSFRVNLNVDTQPVWGPTGYDHVEYYYLPDIGAYYNVPQQKFYYNERGHWVGRSQLPARYHNYDLYKSYKVVVNEQEPYLKDKFYQDKYSSFKGRHDQQAIRDSRDSKYFVNKNHPEHNKWMKQQPQPKNNGKGNVHSNRRNKNNEQNKRRYENQ